MFKSPSSARTRGVKGKAARGMVHNASSPSFSNLSPSSRDMRHIVRENAMHLKEIFALKKHVKHLEKRCSDLANFVDDLQAEKSAAAFMLQPSSRSNEIINVHVKQEASIESLPVELNLLEQHALEHRLGAKVAWCFDRRLRSSNVQLTNSGSMGIPLGGWNTIVSSSGLDEGMSFVTSSIDFMSGHGVFPFSLEGNMFVTICVMATHLLESYFGARTPSERQAMSREFDKQKFIAGPPDSGKQLYILDTDKQLLLLHDGSGSLEVVQREISFPCRLLVRYKNIGSGTLTVDSSCGLSVLDLTRVAVEDGMEDEDVDIGA